MPNNWKTTLECPTVSYCFCCIPLKIGGLILGVVDILICLFFVYADGKHLISEQPESSWDKEALVVLHTVLNCMYFD